MKVKHGEPGMTGRRRKEGTEDLVGWEEEEGKNSWYKGGTRSWVV